MLTIQELIRLKTDKLDKARVKLVRHKDSRLEYRDLLKDKESLLKYQKEQSKEIFKDTDYIVSFIGQESTKALLFGIFKVGDVSEKNDKYYYELSEVKLCEELIDRAIIDWGRGARKWDQWYERNPKQILEILPKGYLGEFPGLTNFVLDFQELKRLIDNPDANRDWKYHLSSVNGIYMILDTKKGDQYIGSASGKNGIWQRWGDYVKTKHCENVRLEKLFKSDKNYQKNFQFTVLQSLPSNLSRIEVEKIETLYKVKFGTKVHGLNSN
jgi:hypothetical protein